ncbi:MFS transporter [Rubellimicrobium rubrum]|nr:MFS transporter [Rubellimicrobium rubrum]
MSDHSIRSPASPPGPLVTAAVLLLAAMTVMANATISPSLPGLRNHYAGMPGIETLAGLVVTLPSLAVVLTASLMGWLADRADRQRLLLASGLLYAIGGTSGLWVDGLTGLLVGRLVLGVGLAGTMVLATTWSADLWLGAARTRFLGWQGAATSAGGVVVILLGGALAALHWRGAFATYLLVVPVTLLALWALAPYARSRGVAARAVAGNADVADSRAEPFPWRVASFVGTLAFLLVATFYAIPTRLPFLLGEVGLTDPLLIGVVSALVTLTALPGALAYGRMRRQVSAMTIFALSWSVMGLGMEVLAVAPSVTVMALGVALVGLGMGPAIPNHMATLMAAVPAASRGRASALMTVALFGGQFASPLLTGSLLAAFDLRGAFAALAVLQFALGVALATAALRERDRPALA